MAEEAPRLSIPGNFVTVDSDAYETGAPASSMLGQQLSQNDRWLAANLLKACGEAMPQQQYAGKARWCSPVAYAGTYFGPIWFVPSSSVTSVDVYVRAEIAVGCIVRLETVNSSPALRPIRRWSGSSHELLGTGAAADYGPYAVPVKPGMPNKLGYVLYPELVDAVTDSGDVQQAGDQLITSTSNEFAGLIRPYNVAIGVYRTVGGATEYWSEFRDVINVQQVFTDGDTVRVLQDDNSAEHLCLNDNFHWELRTVAECYVLCHYLTETTPSKV